MMSLPAPLSMLGVLLVALACAPAAPSPAAPKAIGTAPATAAAASAPVASAPAIAAAAATPAPVAVKYGIAATSLNFIAQQVAVDQGIYRQNGLDVELVQIGAGVMGAAQLAGEIDYSTSYPAGIRLAAQ